MLTLDKIYHAAFVLKKVARKTDLIKATKLSDHCELYLKTENLQETGSFKLRGAYYKISQLSEEEKQHGILACSAGNHAQGVAMAATQSGIKSLICMPDGASRRRLGPPSSTPLMTMRSSPARGPSAWKFWTSWKAPMPWWSPLAAVG